MFLFQNVLGAELSKMSILKLLWIVLAVHEIKEGYFRKGNNEFKEPRCPCHPQVMRTVPSMGVGKERVDGAISFDP
jgi:hypothetical protein